MDFRGGGLGTNLIPGAEVISVERVKRGGTAENKVNPHATAKVGNNHIIRTGMGGSSKVGSRAAKGPSI